MVKLELIYQNSSKRSPQYPVNFQRGNHQNEMKPIAIPSATKQKIHFPLVLLSLHQPDLPRDVDSI